jgi:hypothetical protein
MDKRFDEWEFSPFGTLVFYMSWDTFANIHFIIKIMYKKTFNAEYFANELDISSVITHSSKNTTSTIDITQICC